MPPGGAADLRAGRLVAAAGRHVELLLVLGPAAVLRLLVDRHAVPGVYQDSLVYLRAAPHAPWAPFSPTRPSGYPLLLRIVGALPGNQLDTTTLVQHLAGLVVGALVYFVVVASGGRRWVALAATGVVVFDAYTVALEQSILSEAFFTLALAACVSLVLRRSRGPWAAVGGGLLLGLACTVRSVGLFAVPVWALWLGLSRPGWRTVASGLAAAVLPILGYCALHAAGGAGFALQGSDGWFLYAKVGPIVDCKGASVAARARPLCERPGPDRKSFEFYLYDGASPAYELFHGGQAVYLEDAITPENNRVLRAFSLGVVRAHPLAFLDLVGRESLRYLGPSKAQTELSLYGRPGTLLQRYERTAHVRWWMPTAALVAGLAGAVLGRRRRELSLLVGLPVALVLGAAATSGFNNRYLVPTFPFLAAAAALAVDEILRWRDRRRPGCRADPG
jgi:hypothetical protein